MVSRGRLDRWHREGFPSMVARSRATSWKTTHRCRMPPADFQQMAAENGLWGAPLIHGELPKLGIAVSERTVEIQRILRNLRPDGIFADHNGQVTHATILPRRHRAKMLVI